MTTMLLKSRLLQSSAVAAAILTATAAGAATPNTTPSAVNGFNLLAPFLGLNTSAYGPQTLAANLAATIAVNNGATAAQQALAISDNNILYSTSNAVIGIPGLYGIAANLAGSIPPQPTSPGSSVPEAIQPYGGLGATLGAIYDQGVNAYANGSTSALSQTVGMLASASYFDLVDAVAAKNYFADGTDAAGTAPAVAPPGFSLPTHNGLPNTTSSVYDTAYNVSNTDPGQNPMGNSRPFQVSGKINQIDPSVYPSLVSSPAFPSGHTSFAYTESMLIGMMVPQLYQSMLVRASEYGNSRIVLGVHYALDVVGGRALAEYDLAQAFTNPLYQNNANVTGTPIALQATFAPAANQLNAYMTQELTANSQFSGCGSTVAACAASQVNPYAPSAQNAATYAERLTYGLPTLSYAAAPQETAPANGPDASILLATLYGGSTQAAHMIAPNGGLDANLATATINQIIVNTEGEALAAFYGTSLSYWTRLNLYAAAGYFQAANGTLRTADGDHVTTSVTVGGSAVGTSLDGVVGAGVIDVTGKFTIDGDLDVLAGSGLGFTLGGLVPETGYSQIDVGGASDLDGFVDLTLGAGFALAYGDAFDLIKTGAGLTDNITSLVFDGSVCSSLGGGLYGCGGDRLWLGVRAGDDLTLAVEAVPEPATWAMMLVGFAGLGFAGLRRATARAAA